MQIERPTDFNTPHGIKTVTPYGNSSYKVSMIGPRSVDVIIIDQEDLYAILPLCIKSQYAGAKLRMLVWADKKSMALARFVKEGYDARPDSEKLYVRFINENTVDFRRDNLEWSISSSGKIVKPEFIGDRQEKRRKVILKWNGFRLLFLEQAHADAALVRLEAGESPYNILQTGRQRQRPLADVAGISVADWAIWIRGRQKDMSEIQEWLTYQRQPRPYEDEYLRRILERGWTQFGTDGAHLLAVGIAMWLDRKVQAEGELPYDDPGYGAHRSTVIVKATKFEDPFEDYSDVAFGAFQENAYASMPDVKASFSIESGVVSDR